MLCEQPEQGSSMLTYKQFKYNKFCKIVIFILRQIYLYRYTYSIYYKYQHTQSQTHSFKSTSNTVHRSQTFPCEITEIADKPFKFDGFEAQLCISKQRPKIVKYFHTMFHLYSRHYNSTIKCITDCSDCGRNASVKSTLF